MILYYEHVFHFFNGRHYDLVTSLLLSPSENLHHPATLSIHTSRSLLSTESIGD